MTITCVNDSRPVADGYLCSHCTTYLREKLAEVPALEDEIAVTVTRQARVSRRNGPRSSERAMPVNWPASITDGAVRNTFVTWARHIAEERGTELNCPDTLTGISQWLLGPRGGTSNVEWLRHREEAGQAYDELTYACSALWRAVDAPAGRDSVGRCDDCGTDLWARENAVTVACRTCGAEYDIQKRRLAKLAERADELLTASHVRMVLAHVGWDVTVDQISGWKAREKITAHPPADGDKHRINRYRLGDILERLAESRRESGGVA